MISKNQNLHDFSLETLHVILSLIPKGKLIQTANIWQSCTKDMYVISEGLVWWICRYMMHKGSGVEWVSGAQGKE